MAKHYQLIIIRGWKLHLGPYSSLKSQNMREFDPHYIWVHPLRIEWLPQFTSFGQPLVSFRVLQINLHLTPYSSSRSCPFMMASWAICYSFKKFHSWLLSRRGWSKGLKSPSLLAWVGRDNRTYGGVAFRTGAMFGFNPIELANSTFECLCLLLCHLDSLLEPSSSSPLIIQQYSAIMFNNMVNLCLQT